MQQVEDTKKECVDIVKEAKASLADVQKFFNEEKTERDFSTWNPAVLLMLNKTNKNNTIEDVKRLQGKDCNSY
jgi:hypothetical protein